MPAMMSKITSAAGATRLEAAVHILLVSWRVRYSAPTPALAKAVCTDVTDVGRAISPDDVGLGV